MMRARAVFFRQLEAAHHRKLTQIDLPLILAGRWLVLDVALRQLADRGRPHADQRVGGVAGVALEISRMLPDAAAIARLSAGRAK
jgi:hypothetical protein